MKPEVTVGDDVGILCTLSRGGSVISIDATSTIRASISNARKDISYTGAVAISISDSNHNLPVGVVWISILASATLKLVPGDAVLEIEIADPTQTVGNKLATWYLPITIQDTQLT